VGTSCRPQKCRSDRRSPRGGAGVLRGRRGQLRARGGDGEPVLCIHGIPASSFLYRKVLPVLARRGLRAIAFDLPGLGLAERPEAFDYTWSGLAEWCAAAVDELGLGRFHLVVHDYGGPVGFELCARIPERIRSLTIRNTLIDVERFRRPLGARTARPPARVQAGLETAAGLGVPAVDAAPGDRRPHERDQRRARRLARAPASRGPRPSVPADGHRPRAKPCEARSLSRGARWSAERAASSGVGTPDPRAPTRAGGPRNRRHRIRGRQPKEREPAPGGQPAHRTLDVGLDPAVDAST
jgi:pimeloyl-ACP methyl ester carboxylesterase